MYFELTEALIDDILFSMEDQQGNFLVDIQEGKVVNIELSGSYEAEPAGGNRYSALPEWDSSDGFHLMERFTAGFKNQTVQRELTSALNQGKGVFRAFKNTLNRYPEAEKRWFAFKEQKMKREIVQWYNALRDAWGLERIGTEPEETDDLVLSDFIFRVPEEKDFAAAEALHRWILEDTAGDEKTPVSMTESVQGDLSLIAETGSGDFAGYIGVIRKEAALQISALEVKPEFRGLGIGEELCSRLLNSIDLSTIAYITLDLPAEAENFSRVLLRKCFKPYATRYYITKYRSE